MGKHLTLDDRMEIQKSLCAGKSFNEIADKLGKSRSTISREVKKRYITAKKGSYGRAFNECVHRIECKAVGICEDEPDCVSKRCRNCLKCNSVCQNFEKEICRRFFTPPYVCNGCDRRHNCSLEKRLYDAVTAEKEYRAELSQSREGFNMT